MYHTNKEGIIYNPDTSKGLECYVDEDLVEMWQQPEAKCAGNVMSRTVIFIMYADCPIFWHSSLQTKIVLSTAEAEYMSLSSSLRQVLPLMTMMEEIEKLFPLIISKPNFVCKVH